MKYKVFRTFNKHGIECRHHGLIATGQVICDSEIYDEVYSDSDEFHWTFDRSHYSAPDCLKPFDEALLILLNEGRMLDDACRLIFDELINQSSILNRETIFRCDIKVEVIER